MQFEMSKSTVADNTSFCKRWSIPCAARASSA